MKFYKYPLCISLMFLIPCDLKKSTMSPGARNGLTLVCLVSSLYSATPTCNAINQPDKFNYPAVCDKAGRASSLLSNFTYLASPLSFPLLPSTRTGVVIQDPRSM